MAKTIIPVLMFVVSIFAQTEIPTPIGARGIYFCGATAIGDYDGDGSNDILVTWCDSSETGNFIEHSIYSFKKSQTLLTINSDEGHFVLAADLNDDKKVEIVVGSKIYSYDSPLSKKKH